MPKTSGILLALLLALGCRMGLAESPGIPIRDNLPPQSCRVSLEGPTRTWEDGDTTYTQTPEFSCSGTIIGPSELLTAAHCFSGKTFVRGFIYCPNQPPQLIADFHMNPNFKGKGDKMNSANGPYDSALVKIAGVFPMPAIRLPRDADEIASLVKDPYQCVDSGYGNPNGGKPIHHSSDVQIQDFKTKITHFLRYPDGEQVITGYSTQLDRIQNGFLQLRVGSIHHGDSGGGLMCKDSRGQWVLVAINSGSPDPKDLDKNDPNDGDITTTVGPSLDWLRGYLGPAFPDNRPAVAHAAPRQFNSFFSHNG